MQTANVVFGLTVKLVPNKLSRKQPVVNPGSSYSPTSFLGKRFIFYFYNTFCTKIQLLLLLKLIFNIYKYSFNSNIHFLHELPKFFDASVYSKTGKLIPLLFIHFLHYHTLIKDTHRRSSLFSGYVNSAYLRQNLRSNNAYAASFINIHLVCRCFPFPFSLCPIPSMSGRCV